MIKSIFKDWTKFELIWLSLFSIVNLYLFFAWDDTFIGLVSSMAGMLCVILVAKGKIGNYYFGIIQTGTYAYISFNYGLYGETMLNGLFYFPLQFVGIYLWSRSKIKAKDSTVGEDIIVKKMNLNQWLVLIIAGSIAIVLFTILLNHLGGNTTGLDSTTTILSIIAQILMLYRFAEQWIIWIIINILTITMWFIALGMSDTPSDHTMLVMWTFFLFNSIYGYINWRRMLKKQESRNIEREVL